MSDEKTKNDERTAAALAALHDAMPAYKHRADGGNGIFTFLIGALAEADLCPVGLWRDEGTGIDWVLPLGPEEWRNYEPVCSPEVVRLWSALFTDPDMPQRGTSYRHYKGSLYVVRALALRRHNHAVHPVVLYTKKDGAPADPVWCRPVEDFQKVILIPRFAKE